MDIEHSLPVPAPRSRPLAARGFTAIELMVVVAIAAILATLALPSFDQMLKRWQMRQGLNALADTIYFARSEAVKWGGNVQIVKIPNSATCTTSTAADWSCGWQVRLTLNPLPAGVTNPLKIVRANEKNDVMAPNSTLTLNRWGNPSAGYNIHVQHKREDGDLSLNQYLCLSSGGRLRQTGSC